MIQSVRIKNFKTFKDTQIDGFTKLNIITGLLVGTMWVNLIC